MKHTLTAAEIVGAKKPADDWPRVRAAHLAKQPRCEKPDLGAVTCLGAVQVHHVTPRSMGGTRGGHGPLLSLCLAHHSWAESNRGKARQLGLLLRREVSP